MQQISQARWLLSGMMAGMVIDSIQYLFDSFVFPDQWDALARAVTPDPAQAVFALTSTKIVALMQIVGLAAGMLAVRLGAPHVKGRTARNAAMAWLFTYGLICIAIFLISQKAPNPAQRPVKFAHGLGFALSSLAGCWAGSWFGAWVYRQSEEAASERAVEA